MFKDLIQSLIDYLDKNHLISGYVALDDVVTHRTRKGNIIKVCFSKSGYIITLNGQVHSSTSVDYKRIHLSEKVKSELNEKFINLAMIN